MTDPKHTFKLIKKRNCNFDRQPSFGDGGEEGRERTKHIGIIGVLHHGSLRENALQVASKLS